MGRNLANPVFYLNKARALLTQQIRAARCQPVSATLELTYRCNLRCQTCGTYRKGIESAGKELGTEEVMGVLDQMRDMGIRHVALIGAEPLMRKDVMTAIGAVLGRGMSCSLTTNATLLDEDMIGKLLDNPPHAVTISIDAPDATHDEIRGRQVFERVRLATAELVKARNARKLCRPVLQVHCTISALNVAVFGRMAAFCEDLGVDVLSVQYLSETTPEAVRTSVMEGEVIASDRFIPHQQSLRLQPEHMAAFRREMKTLMHHRGRTKVAHRQVSALSEAQLLNAGFPVKRCYMIRDHLIVDPYGNVTPCANIDKFLLGNTREQPLAEIWRGARARKLRSLIGRCLLPVCRACCQFSHNWTPAQQVHFTLRSLSL